MAAIKTWNGGVILISHDTRFITTGAFFLHTVPLSLSCSSLTDAS